jgi:Glycosyl transferase family 11
MNKVLIYGGLGNQMFQYALNIALNQKGNKSKILFSNFFYDNHHNGFNLGYAFKLDLPLAARTYNFLLLNAGILYKNKISNKVLGKFIPRYHNSIPVFNEKKEFIFDEEVFHQKSKLIIGTWQSEDYFKDIRSILLKEFVFKQPTDKKNQELISEIKTNNSISVHIRRGDYLKARWFDTHAVIRDAKYYIDSIEHINSKVEDPRYFIFSDDISWAKENLELSNCTFIDHNSGKDAYIDMYLMSLCKHNITANSTFSWWAAWLNKNEGKIVIMPERWLNNISAPGIFPSEWLKFKV